uniref:Uncharacterized protein n=1 Tax=Timema tahoe TaxID=61484 RepID=A0A7R9IAM7_9NEOP|nr:unnamed protein product [Timema tahoe]
MYHIVEIVHRWDGPVSVAVFVPYTDAGLCLAVVDHLCRCLPEMSQLSLHFIFPSTLPPIVSWTSVDYNETHMKSPKKPEFLDCSAPKDLFVGQFKTFRSQEGLTYPVNVARNVARRGAQTWHILVSDVELLPSEGLVPGFISMLSRFRKKRGHYSTSTKFVFVVPVFEVDESLHNVPMTKEQLLDLYAQNKAVYFHRWVCLHCQRFPGLQRWLQRKPGVGGTSFVQPILVVRREFPYHRWEPIYIGTNQDPLYSEVLTWEGQQDKMAQMGEMCLMGYRFIILDGAFLVHTPSIKRRSDITIERTAWRRPHERRNIKMYESVVYKLIHKYGKNNSDPRWPMAPVFRLVFRLRRGSTTGGADLVKLDSHMKLRYALLRYATLRYALLRYATLRYALLRYATLRYATLRYATLRYAILCCAILCFKIASQEGASPPIGRRREEQEDAGVAVDVRRITSCHHMVPTRLQASI